MKTPVCIIDVLYQPVIKYIWKKNIYSPHGSEKQKIIFTKKKKLCIKIIHNLRARNCGNNDSGIMLSVITIKSIANQSMHVI